MATVKDFRNNIKPNWCPGCGDFSVQASIQRACANLGLEPEQVAIISGIGCSGRISGYINAYGFHGVHGRALPLAQGVKLANRELTVIAAGGDGDGFAIGLNHTIHAMRRNIDITYIVMDNQVYGLTKGQTSPRSQTGFVTKSTPQGAVEQPIAPIEMALAAGASFVAQGFSSNVKQLTSLIEQAIQHRGFSFVNVFSPCVTYNKINTYDWFRQNVVELGDDYEPYDRQKALQIVHETNGLVTGLLYVNRDAKPYEDLLQGFTDIPFVNADLTVAPDQFQELLQEFV